MMPVRSGSCRESKPTVARARPGSFSDQQCDLYRDQWLGRLQPCALSLDGNPAGDGVCRWRCPELDSRGPNAGPIGPQALFSTGPSGGHRFGWPGCMGSVASAVLVAVRCDPHRGFLQCERPTLSLRRTGTLRPRISGSGDLVGDGRWASRGGDRPEPCAPYPGPARGPVCGGLPRVDGCRCRRPGGDFPHQLPPCPPNRKPRMRRRALYANSHDNRFSSSPPWRRHWVMAS